jgi:hypothetical protein
MKKKTKEQIMWVVAVVIFIAIIAIALKQLGVIK